jgi:hypothetical protein
MGVISLLIISCHADTGFYAHSLRNVGNGVVEGNPDNFAGVYAVMKAFFSGRLCHDYLRIELTYGEESDFAGALEVQKSLRKHDVIIVVDVTGTETICDMVFEKCRQRALKDYLSTVLEGMSFEIHEHCPDPVADENEVDVYSKSHAHVCMLAIPCQGGDYNEGAVQCREKSIDAVAEALCRIAGHFPSFCTSLGIVES